MASPSPEVSGALVLAAVCSLLLGCSTSFYLAHGIKPAKLPEQKSSAYRALNAQQQDVLYLSTLLEESYPTPVDEIYPDGQYRPARDQLLRELARPVDAERFELLLSRFVAGVGSTHTWIGAAGHSDQSGAYPVALAPGQRVYLAAVGPPLDPRLAGSEVVSIGGRLPEDALKCLASYASGDNDYSRRHAALALFRKPRFAVACGLTRNPRELALVVRGRDGASRALAVTAAERGKVRLHAPRPKPGLVPPSSAPFSFKILPAQDLAYLRLGSMLDRTALLDAVSDFVPRSLVPLGKLYTYALAAHGHIPRLAPLLEALFADVARQGIGNLVIDLRGNGGGDERLGKQLLYFLDLPRGLKDFREYMRISPLYKRNFRAEYRRFSRLYREQEGRPLPDGQLVRTDDLGVSPRADAFFHEIEDPRSPMYVRPPRVRFRGSVYLLIDSGTQSAAMDFATLVKDNHIGRLVGTPSGGRPTGPTNLSFNRLPNSRLVFSLCTEYDFRPDSHRDGDPALFPDDLVDFSYPDYLEGRDPQLARVLALIHPPARAAQP